MKCAGKDEKNDIMTDSQLNLNFINNNTNSDNGYLIGTGVDNVIDVVSNENVTELFVSAVGWLFNTTQFNDSFDESITTASPYSNCDWAPDNKLWNCSKEDYVLHYRGPKQLPLATALSVSEFSF